MLFLPGTIDDSPRAMSDNPPNPALLPAGLCDLLPPDAETEASAVETLMDVFASHGYQRVKPRGRAQSRSAQQELLDLLAESKSPEL